MVEIFTLRPGANIPCIFRARKIHSQLIFTAGGTWMRSEYNYCNIFIIKVYNKSNNGPLKTFFQCRFSHYVYTRGTRFNTPISTERGAVFILPTQVYGRTFLDWALLSYDRSPGDYMYILIVWNELNSSYLI